MSDPVSDVLRLASVGASIVLHDRYDPPWSVSIPPSNELAALVGAHGADRVAAFHYAQSGSLLLDTDGSPPIQIHTGDLVIGFGGYGHQLRKGHTTTSTPLQALVTRTPPPSPDPATGPSTTLLCGVFILQHLQNTPLAHALPPFVHLQRDHGAPHDIMSLIVTERARHQPGADFVIGRLLELALAEALRQTALHSDGRPNWLTGTLDPVVLTALTAIHAEPDAPWTLHTLATRAAISSSRLTARFRKAVGTSPMGYVTTWRMLTAAELLDVTNLSVEQIGLRVGYSNQPAFTRAFRRHFGVAPRQYRTQREAA